MLRFPNPGSDIDSFIRIFTELFDALNQRKEFGLDDISKVMIERNLATSCGYMGDEALSRSTRADRSRDPLYNQSKMYSELFKILGWIHPSSDVALKFQFTYLGAHVPVIEHESTLFIQQCLLGVVYPNPVLNVIGNYKLRPFACILKTMNRLGGLICRDEIIVGPLSLDDDRNNSHFETMISQIATTRGNYRQLTHLIAKASRIRKITHVTMGNYTRFPIGVLKWTGWAQSEIRKDIYNRPTPFLVLTSVGKQTIQAIDAMSDLRGSDLENFSEQTKAAAMRLGFYQMLDRSGFDITLAENQMQKDLLELRKSYDTDIKNILFSPFQALPLSELTKHFPSILNQQDIVTIEKKKLMSNNITVKSIPLLHKVDLIKSNVSHGNSQDRMYRLLKKVALRWGNDERAIEAIAWKRRKDNKQEFYPFVCELFKIIGYNCRLSRAGVNYQRWDAMIEDKKYSIPIEIKSPGEEEYISVKGVRQALENKVILLSRKMFHTEVSTTSLVVGFNIPNDRSEVNSLILDISNTFNISVGVVDIRSLLRIAIAEIIDGKKHDIEAFRLLRGFINVSDT